MYVTEGERDCDRLSGEYYRCVTVLGEEHFIIQQPGRQAVLSVA